MSPSAKSAFAWLYTTTDGRFSGSSLDCCLYGFALCLFKIKRSTCQHQSSKCGTDCTRQYLEITSVGHCRNHIGTFQIEKKKKVSTMCVL